MTAEDAGQSGAGRRRRIATIASLIIALIVVVAVWRMIGDARGWVEGMKDRTTLSQEMVVEEVRAVAKLV